MLDTAQLACNDTVPMSDSNSTWSVHVALSPPNGWNNYNERRSLYHGLTSDAIPPFESACFLTVAARRGQRLNVTVITMGQYGVRDIDLGGAL